MKKFIVSTILSIISLILPTKVYAIDIIVSGNGSDSQNVVETNITQETTVEQTSNAIINNNIQINSNTGNNTANDNTGGNTDITTGNISVESDILNTANLNSISVPCCPMSSESNIEISGNGSGSDNQVNVTSPIQLQASINNFANITNNINGIANTGSNSASGNGGNVTIETGSIIVSEKLKNGPLNIYFILMGIDDPGFNISITNNGSNSKNDALLNLAFSSSLFVNNQANIENTSSWDLNTGNNVSDDNLGDIKIKTGDISLTSLIDNGPINSGQVILTCCPKQDDTPTPLTPVINPPGAGGPISEGAGAGGGAALAASAGQILPATGNSLTLLLTFLASLMFFLGLYLRLHPGQDPGRRLYFSTAH